MWSSAKILAVVAAFLLPTLSSAQEVVSIPTPDGGTVTADLYGSGERGVVLAPGGRFDRSSWAEQARVLERAGFRVLAIDFRAAAGARGEKDTACLYDESCLAVDVLAAVRDLRRRGATSVSVIGASVGGSAAAQASVEAGEGEIDRLILLAHAPIGEPERMKGRKLFVVGREDRGPRDVPRLDRIREQCERAPGPSRLLVLETAAHAQFIFTTPEAARLMEEIVRFLGEP